ncbi:MULTISPECIES: hypothetical protein [Enterococcus]|uniref:hypothetical protein n=1 Tax=Enterococcus TaxID=1350 RepID=UPI00065E2F7F|nr:MULTISPECIES: hypothetical protein [Enterococcus]KAF1301409.1 hypothetical protein BAU16_09365 [Enterococcus sp. JM9B]
MALTVKQTEDFLTTQVSGITVMDVSVEYPDSKEVLYIEGEQEYYLFINEKEHYLFTDGKKNVKLEKSEDDPDLSEETFLDRMVKVILSEE